MPEVRGTADVGWRSLFPLPVNPPRTHSRLYHDVLCTNLMPFEATVCLGLRPASQRSPYTNYLRLAW